MLILETPFWEAGAAESVKIGIIVIGASNKSGRRCKPSNEFSYAESMDIGIIVIGVSNTSGQHCILVIEQQ